MSDRKRGTVKWFNNKKGYGFITLDGDAKDLFAHFSEIQGDGYRSLNEGDPVEFENAARKSLGTESIERSAFNMAASGKTTIAEAMSVVTWTEF